jgi:hypothetical protein
MIPDSAPINRLPLYRSEDAVLGQAYRLILSWRRIHPGGIPGRGSQALIGTSQSDSITR